MAVDSGTYTPETIARKKKLAEALLMKSLDPRQIDHWTQGAAQMAQAGVAAYGMRKADEEDRSDRSEMAKVLGGMLGGPGAAAPMPNFAPSSPSSPGPVPMASPPTNGKVYANDEPSPLDPPSGKDRDIAIRTMYGEAANEPAIGQQAVANVIRNRAVSGKYGGDTASGVALSPNQFEPWNTAGNRQRMASLDPNSAKYAQLGQALDKAYTGDDPTNGAVNFFAPKAQAALGRNVPAWGREGGQDIGNHRFFGGRPQPEPAPMGAMAFNGQPSELAAVNPQGMPTPQAAAQPPMPAQQAPSAQPPQPDMKAQIAAMLQSKSPRVQQMGQSLAQSMISNQMSGDKPTDEMREYNLYRSQGGKDSFFDYKAGLKKAGAQNINIDQKGQSSFATAAGSAQAKRFDELAGEGPKAQQMQSDIAVLTDLGNKIQTGKLAEVKAALGPFADAMGVKVEGLSEIQAFEAIVNRMAPNLRVPGSGAQSDYELKNFLKSLPALGNTPEGNEIGNTVLQGLIANKRKAAEIGAMALNEQIGRPEAEKMLRELPDPMDQYREYMKKTRGAPSASGPAGVPDRSAIEQEMKRRGLLK
jgi:spore germination cell wall hydrolase CwlJ-like protein